MDLAPSKLGVMTARILLVILFMRELFAQGPPIDSSAAQVYEAHATAVTGEVTRTIDAQPWAVSPGERVPIRQTITTGRDGYAKFDVAGGSSFELFSNSRVVFRQNTASAGDLLDISGGRVRVHLQPTLGQPQQRVFTPVATLTSVDNEPVTIAIAVDEDETVRIDVLEGEIRVQHALLPRGDPTLVRAVDAILVQKDQPISRKVDRGSLYRYAIKLKGTLLGHPSGQKLVPEPLEGTRFLAQARPLQ